MDKLMMKRELKDAIVNMESLDNLVFPADKLPFPITDTLLNAVIWAVPDSHTELDMVDWMNSVVMQVKTHTNVDPCRKWDPCMMNQIMPGSTIRCKPDLVLVDEDFSTDNVLRGGKPNWREFHVYTEVTCQTTQYRLNRTTWQKSFAMFESQPTRWFIPSLMFRKDHAAFVACNCAGGVHTNPLLLEESKRELMQCIVGFAFGDEHLLGYDLMMKCSAGDTITAISIAGEKYTVIRRLFKSSAMRGHATQCWHVCGKDSVKYIIKDSWINSRQVNEIEILGELTGVENVSTLVKGWDVTLPD